jgi:hypothetical protein
MKLFSKAATENDAHFDVEGTVDLDHRDRALGLIARAANVGRVFGARQFRN